MEKINNFRSKLKTKNKHTIGFWSQYFNYLSIKTICDLNYDWICLDMEHGIYDFKDISRLTDLIKFKKKFPFVRLSSSNTENIQKALDAGSLGLILPMIENPLHLDSLIKKTVYPPTGNRSVGYSNSNEFGKNLNSDLENKFRPIVIIQIESKLGVENIEEITNQSGIDGILIGPYDLSSSLGCPGDFSNKNYQDALNKIYKVLSKKNIANGYHIVIPEPSELLKRKEEGYNFIAYGTESSFMKSFFNI